MCQLAQPIRSGLAILLVAAALPGWGQAGDKALRAEADALFEKGAYAKAWPMYSQLVSLSPQDHELNYKFGACSIYGDDDKAKAIGYLKYAVSGPATSDLAWYFLGKAYQLDYRFDEALDAYKRFKGTADKKLLARFAVDALEKQSRNGKYLLSNLKDIDVLNKVAVSADDFFRFYDLSDIGGKIVVTPDELLSGLDKKSGERFLLYLPKDGGPIYFSSYGKDGKTGRDIYRTELLPTGAYAAPQKLAGYINTDQDEDFAVMAPDGKNFYFCSKGHNSMGGYDVFRSVYDRGMDVFSAPENMDFAVNTPADEMLYIVGPDGSQACFASDRDSRQGEVNVYRVGTAQTPLNLTVFKGTYASLLGNGAKKAHIIVEDELTRARVADVHTDANGEYVLVVPKGGRYKFLVEEEGVTRTYWAAVDVPAAHKPQAFRQEMELEAKAGGRLDVKNHFDAPLDEDVMALALEEIRKRARLDVTGVQAVAEIPASAGSLDPMQDAGFDGWVTLEEAVEQARTEAEKEDALALVQDKRSAESFELALLSLEQAEAYAAQAAAWVKEAQAGAPVSDKNRLMRQAAEAKQRSQEAGLRAQVAMATGNIMRTAATQTRVDAGKATALHTELVRAQTANDQTRLTSALKQLKAELDGKKGPDARTDELERMRREAAEAGDEAARKMRSAAAQREDESALADQIQNLTREAGTAKGRKKEELETKLAMLKGQHQAMQQEVSEAFHKADMAEEAAATGRGQVELLKYLTGRPGESGAAAPDAGELASVERRLAEVRASNQALAIEQQYEPQLTAQERERRTFDWNGPEVLALRSGIKTSTLVAQPLPGGNMHQVPQTSFDDEPLAVAGTSTGTGETTTTSSAQTSDNPLATGANQDEVPQSTTGAVAAAGATNSLAQEGKQAGGAQGDRTTPLDATASGGSLDRPAPTPGAAAANRDGEAGRTGGTEPAPALTVDEQAFLLANKLAELEQLRVAERSRGKRDSLDQEISLLKAGMETLRAGGSQAGKGRSTMGDGHIYTYLDFDPTALDEELVEEAFPGFRLALFDIQEGDGSDVEKAHRIQALEIRLVDSVDVQIAMALAQLEQHPERSDRILPQIQRWRDLKQEHVLAAERALAHVGQEYAASETSAMEDELLSGTKQPAGAERPAGGSTTPHNDAYVTIDPDPAKIYLSRMEPRSAQLKQAVARKENDLEKARTMQAEIDSMELALGEITAAKEYNKMRQQIDRKIDDLLIHDMDLGQRMAFISRGEYDAAKDSSKVLSKQLAQRGLAPNEPLLEMARSYEQEADAGMGRAKTLRKQADNAKDILRRNALYRQAYGEELEALRSMDRSLTVRSYLVGGSAVPGEALSYDEVEARLFPEVLAAADAQREMAGPNKAATEPGTSGGTAPKKDDQAGTTVAEMGQPPMDTGRPSQDMRAADHERSAGDSAVLAGYLDRFYYLEPSERMDVMGHHDAAHYFRMKGKSMQDRSDAVGKEEEADGARALAAALREEARSLRTQGQGRLDVDTIHGQIAKLEARADALFARADSLQAMANKLVAGAEMTDAQAAAWMQGLPPGRPEELMGLEQSRRRTEPLLARTRPAVTTPAAPSRAEPPAPVTPEVVAMQATSPSAQQQVQAPSPTAMTVQGTPAAQPPVVAGETRHEGDGTRAKTDVPSRLTPVPSMDRSLADLAGRQLATDLFTFREAGAARAEAIPIDAPMPTGVVYKVQVGAFRNELPLEAFSDMSPITGENAGNGLVRYTAGMFTSAESARQAGQRVRERGYRDAFVVAYMDGRRVSLREAMVAEREVQREQASLATTTTTTTTTISPAPGTPVRPESATRQEAVPTAPVAVPPANLSDGQAQAAAEMAVLADYPATAEELLAAFAPSETAAGYYNDPTAAPARQVETVKGLFFTVQVGVYSKPTALDRLFNITPLNSELTPNGKIRYTTGFFLNEAQAAQRKNGAVTLGVTDAFVTAYLNGKRIPLRDARALLAKFGTAILAEPVGQER